MCVYGHDRAGSDVGELGRSVDVRISSGVSCGGSVRFNTGCECSLCTFARFFDDIAFGRDYENFLDLERSMPAAAEKPFQKGV